jgi:hypothetical protein
MDLRYPIGKFQFPAAVTEADREQAIGILAAAPQRFREAACNLTGVQLDTPYRPGGWTVRQVVHHVADSHINSYVRCRLALTEDEPTVKTYEEARWAELPDARTLPVEISLQLIASLHLRWVGLFRNLAPADFARAFRHPALGVMTLDTTLALYAWHSRHHEAHITALRGREGW